MDVVAAPTPRHAVTGVSLFLVCWFGAQFGATEPCPANFKQKLFKNRVLLKTDSGYPKETEVTTSWKPLGIPFA